MIWYIQTYIHRLVTHFPNWTDIDVLFIDLERNVEVGSNESDITLDYDSKELKYVLDVLKDLGINIKPNKKNRIYKINMIFQIM